uniref:Uncharacterized protein n=1 Tax=Anguilla anguilla TaxID=7936 RepID=A0A0E9TKX5_ANGAN
MNKTQKGLKKILETKKTTSSLKKPGMPVIGLSRTDLKNCRQHLEGKFQCIFSWTQWSN